MSDKRWRQDGGNEVWRPPSSGVRRQERVQLWNGQEVGLSLVRPRVQTASDGPNRPPPCEGEVTTGPPRSAVFGHSGRTRSVSRPTSRAGQETAASLGLWNGGDSILGTGRIGRAGAGKTGSGWREGWGLGTAGARRRSRVLGHGHAGARTSQQHGGRACLQGSEPGAQRSFRQRGREAGGGGKYPGPPLGCPLPSHRPSSWQNLPENMKAREQRRQLPVIQTHPRQTDTEREPDARREKAGPGSRPVCGHTTSQGARHEGVSSASFLRVLRPPRWGRSGLPHTEPWSGRHLTPSLHPGPCQTGQRLLSVLG